MKTNFMRQMIEDFQRGIVPAEIMNLYFELSTISRLDTAGRRRTALQLARLCAERAEEVSRRYPCACLYPHSASATDPWSEYRCYGEDYRLMGYMDFIADELQAKMIG